MAHPLPTVSPLAVNPGTRWKRGRSVDDQRALVVESDPSMRRYLEKYMSDRGCQTVIVRSLPDALDQLARDSFNFTVIDLDHEAVAGSNFVSDLKLQRGDPGTVIALTNGQPW